MQQIDRLCLAGGQCQFHTRGRLPSDDDRAFALPHLERESADFDPSRLQTGKIVAGTLTGPAGAVRIREGPVGGIAEINRDDERRRNFQFAGEPGFPDIPFGRIEVNPD